MKISRLVIPLILLFLFTLEGCSLINSLNGFSGRKYRSGIYRHDIGKVDASPSQHQKNEISDNEPIIIDEEINNSSATAGIDSQVVLIENPLKQIFLTQKKKTQTITKQLKSIAEYSKKAKSENETETEWTGLAGLICGILAVLLTIFLLFLLFNGFSWGAIGLYILLYLFALFLAVGGIVFGSMNVSRNKKEPTKYNNSYMGYVGKITGIISAAVLLFTGVVILVILIFILLLFG